MGKFLYLWLLSMILLPALLAGSGIAASGPPLAGSVSEFIAIDPPRPAPTAAFVDGEGRARSLAEFRGRVLLVNFWATWCAPCVAEMPSLDRLQAKLGAEEFTVLAVSVDRAGAAAVEAFYAKHGIGALDIYLDPGMALFANLVATGLPASFILDREGRVVGELRRPAEWDSPEAEALIRHYVDGA
jgi:thiol-disulfide isomerase/thioredoxin